MARKAKYHAKLRQHMRLDEYELDDIAELLGCSVHSIRARLQYKTPWTSFEMIQIMNLLGASYSQMAEYFPPKPDMVDNLLSAPADSGQSCPMLKAFMEIAQKMQKEVAP